MKSLLGVFKIMKPMILLVQSWQMSSFFNALNLSQNKLSKPVLIWVSIFFLQTLQNIWSIWRLPLWEQKIVGSNNFCFYIEKWILTQIKSKLELFALSRHKLIAFCFLFLINTKAQPQLLFILFCFVRSNDNIDVFW